MPRSSNTVASKRRRNRILKRAKGFRGGRSKLIRTANETVNRALAFSYRDRRAKKRDIRGLWIIRISAACKENGVSYSKFMNALKNSNIEMNRKMLSDLAVQDKEGFVKLVNLVKTKVSA